MVGKDNVVLLELRQGAATASSALLTWEGGAFAGVVVMSGWLPYIENVRNYAHGDIDDLYADEWFGNDTHWDKSQPDDLEDDWPTKYFRFEVYLDEKVQ